jgi:hypothetical protein
MVKKIEDEDDDEEAGIENDKDDSEEEIDEELTDRDEDQDDDEESEPEQDEKPEKVGNIGSLVFLKEYAKDINRQYTHVASKLGIAKSSAYKYLQKYMYLTKETIKDPDFPSPPC